MMQFENEKHDGKHDDYFIRKLPVTPKRTKMLPLCFHSCVELVQKNN